MVTSSQGIPYLSLARKAFTDYSEQTKSMRRGLVQRGPGRSSLPGDDKKTTVRAMKRKARVCLSR